MEWNGKALRLRLPTVFITAISRQRRRQQVQVQVLLCLLLVNCGGDSFASAFLATNTVDYTNTNTYVTYADQLTSTSLYTSKQSNVELSRPDFLRSLAIGSATLAAKPPLAYAGLIQFPCKKLANTYHLIRAGQSLLEEEDILATNPLFLTNRECALSDMGIEQIERACQYLENNEENGISPPTLVRYSLAASAIDTANIVGRECRLGRDRLVPEFFFLDPRAVGLWDNLPISQAEPAVWALDVDEAGVDGTRGRPPPNEDGTPSETLSDQVPRLRQLLSACESIYSGDTVLLVFPDGTGPALLSCLIAGIPLNRVHELELKSGEVRCDVNYESVRIALGDKPSDEYVAKIADGREKLKDLRAQKHKIVNVKDQRYEQEIRDEQERVAKMTKERQQNEERERIKREEMNRRIEKERTEKEERKRADKEKNGQLEAKQNAGDISTIDPLPLVMGISFAAVGAIGASSFSDQEDKGKGSGIAVSATSNITAVAEESDIVISNNTISETQTFETDDLAEEISIRSINGVSMSEASPFEQELARDNEEDTILPSSTQADAPQSRPSSTSLLGDGVVVVSTEDREERAEKAMEEYMSQDDGGDAWLSMLSEMISEEDDQEDRDTPPIESQRS